MSSLVSLPDDTDSPGETASSNGTDSTFVSTNSSEPSSSASDLTRIAPVSTSRLSFAGSNTLGGSEDEIESLIIDYVLDPPPSFPLLIQAPYEVLSRDGVSDALRTVESNRRRCKTSYDPKTGILTISMPGVLHIAAEEHVDEWWWTSIRPCLPVDLRERLKIGYVELSMHGSPIMGLKTAQTRNKTPDRAIYFLDDRLNPVTVLFEVGVTQSGIDLEADAINYLERLSNRGKAQLVVLINVEEDREVRDEIWTRPETQLKVDTMVSKYGRPCVKAFHDPDESSESEESDSEIDLGIRECIDPSHWVGPLKATVEFWRAINGKARREGIWVSLRPAELNCVIANLRVESLADSFLIESCRDTSRLHSFF